MNRSHLYPVKYKVWAIAVQHGDKISLELCIKLQKFVKKN